MKQDAMLGDALWRDPDGKALRVLPTNSQQEIRTSVQQPTRNRILQLHYMSLGVSVPKASFPIRLPNFLIEVPELEDPVPGLHLQKLPVNKCFF